MEDVSGLAHTISTNKLRDKSRNAMKINRDNHREHEIDSLRIGLGEIKLRVSEQTNVSVHDVIGLANRIKRRRQADARDLIRLSNGFLQSIDHITAFINVRDAINIIVKILTGPDATLQIMACECLSNLSLGDEHCCEKVAQSAGIYLIIYLNHTNKQLSKMCLWVLANLSAAGDGPLKILLSQKIIPKIITFIEKSKDNDYNYECCATLEAIVEHGKHLMSDDEKEIIFKATLVNEKINEKLKVQLLYKTLVSLDFKIDQAIADRSIIFCVELLHYITESNDESTLKIIYSTRIIGNLVSRSQNTNQKLIDYLIENNLSLCDMLNKLFAVIDHHVINEILWMVGNVYNNSNSNVENYLNRDNLHGNLKVEKNFQFEM